MKSITLILFMIPCAIFGQRIHPCYTQSYPLSYYSTRKMMQDNYAFTILGSATPVSGFKVETKEPNITIKGNLNSPKKDKSLLVNLELTAGVQNNIQQIFSGDRLNSSFSATLGINKMLKIQRPEFESIPEFTRVLLRKKVCDYWEEVAMKVDSLLITLALQKYAMTPDVAMEQVLTDIKTTAAQQGYRLKDGYIRDQPDISKYYEDLLIAMIVKYGAVKDPAGNATTYRNFIAKFADKTDRSLKTQLFLADAQKYLVFEKDKNHKYDLIDRYEIDAYKEVINVSKIRWITVTFTGGNSSFVMYNPIDNTLTPENSFLPSVGVWYNAFRRKSKMPTYLYFRGGVFARKINSLVDLPKFNYTKETVINVNSSEALKDEKKGTAYKGELHHSTGFDVPVELYWSPFPDKGLPGLYGKAQYSYGDIWINKNKVLFEIGLIWNAVNSDQSNKNILTIVPYMGWSNILKEYKDGLKSVEKKLSDLFMVGVRFGIPITLSH